LQILFRSDEQPTEAGFLPLKASSPASPIEETDQFGLQDPPSLARLSGLDTSNTDVFEEGGLCNSQVLTRFLGRQDSILILLGQSLSPHLDKRNEDQFAFSMPNTF